MNTTNRTIQVLLNAFGSMLEIMSLYAKRTIVEKVQHQHDSRSAHG